MHIHSLRGFTNPLAVADLAHADCVKLHIDVHTRAGDTLTFTGVYGALATSPAVKVSMTKAEISRDSGGAAQLRISLALGYGAAMPASAALQSDLVIQRAGTNVANPLGSSAAFATMAASSNMLEVVLGNDAGIRAGVHACACRWARSLIPRHEAHTQPMLPAPWRR